MSGTLFIRNDATWMPSAATVSWVLEELAAEIRQAAPELSTTLLDPSKGQNWGYYDLTSLAASHFLLIKEAMHHVYEREVAKGVRAVARPSSYFFYMSLLSVFKALLRTDPRASTEARVTRTLLINENAQWVAPAWIHDLMMEHLAAFAQASEFPPPEALPTYAREVYEQTLGVERQPDSELAKWLLAARTFCGDDVVNLNDLEVKQFRILVAAAKFILVDFCKTHGDSHAPEVMAKLLPQIEAVAALISADPRAGPF